MTVYQDSRYSGAVQQVLSTNRGVATVVYMQPPITGTRYRLYLTNQGDTFELLAWRLWNDPRLFWRIADMNPQVFFTGDLPAGTLIRLPAS